MKNLKFNKIYDKGDGQNSVVVTTKDSDGLLHVCWNYKGTMFFEKMTEKEFSEATKDWQMC